MDFSGLETYLKIVTVIAVIVGYALLRSIEHLITLI